LHFHIPLLLRHIVIFVTGFLPPAPDGAGWASPPVNHFSLYQGLYCDYIQNAMMNAIKKSLGSTFIPFFWVRQGFFIDIRGIIYGILALKTNMYNGNNGL
jgi:hypothetical protein